MFDEMDLKNASPEEVGKWFAEFAATDLLNQAPETFGTVYADPPWRFTNRTGKMAPEHKRLHRYPTMSLQEICEMPVARIARPQSHIYLWVPNALIQEGLEVLKRWGFEYKTNIIWYRRGVGFYFRNVTEVCLFGTRGKNIRTRQAGRTMPNIITTQKSFHSRKPCEMYKIIESCSYGPYIELFSRSHREGWTMWGNQAGVLESDGLTYEYGYRVDKPVEQLSLLERPVGIRK
jgi:N6-adenosine-specific RNA methylase IME4